MPPLGRLLADTLDVAARLVPCEAGSLLLDDPSRRRGHRQLTVVADFGPFPRVGTTFGTENSIAGDVYRSGSGLRIEDVSGDPRYHSQVERRDWGNRLRSLAAVPIAFERRVCGVLVLKNRKGRGSRGGFTRRDLEFIELVGRTLSSAILNAVDVLKQSQLALHDDLTGLRNVRGLEEQLTALIEGTSDDCSILWIDVDGLKKLNDRLGHTAGSEALIRVSEVVRTLAPAPEFTFRFGGDELVVLCPEHDRKAAEALGEAIRVAVSQKTGGPLKFGGSLPPLTVSVGVASLRSSLRENTVGLAARLLTAGDRALYRAKRGGKNQVACATRRDDPLR